MSRVGRALAMLAVVLGLAGSLAACGGLVANGKATQPLSQATLTRLAAMGSSAAAPMMMRIYKQSSELEVWKQTGSGQYKLFKTYHICAWSGDLGPKISEGDRQSPEGFYTITPGLMNPYSNYYLAFNTGFPNKYDRAYGRTGSNLMVHGDCSSSGCYAMTDDEIAEIYALARETFIGGNPSFQLQIYPFRMTPQNLARVAGSPNMSFWRNIKTGYDISEITGKPPSWDVCNRTYVFNATAPGGAALDASTPCPALSVDAKLAAAVAAKEKADDQAISTAVAALDASQQAAIAAAQKEAADKTAAKARGEAIGGFFSGIGSSIGGLFGGTQAAPQPTEPAPIPASPPART